MLIIEFRANAFHKLWTNKTDEKHSVTAKQYAEGAVFFVSVIPFLTTTFIQLIINSILMDLCMRNGFYSVFRWIHEQIGQNRNLISIFNSQETADNDEETDEFQLRISIRHIVCKRRLNFKISIVLMQCLAHSFLNSKRVISFL